MKEENCTLCELEEKESKSIFLLRLRKDQTLLVLFWCIFHVHIHQECFCLKSCLGHFGCFPPPNSVQMFSDRVGTNKSRSGLQLWQTASNSSRRMWLCLTRLGTNHHRGAWHSLCHRGRGSGAGLHWELWEAPRHSFTPAGTHTFFFFLSYSIAQWAKQQLRRQTEQTFSF